MYENEEAHYMATILERDRLLAECKEWRECVKIDATMAGPKFMGWDRSALDRCRRKFLPHIMES